MKTNHETTPDNNMITNSRFKQSDNNDDNSDNRNNKLACMVAVATTK